MSDSLPVPIVSLTPSQQTAIINLVRRAARAEILPRFRNLSDLDIMTKSGPDDLVTEADKAAEKMIARGLLSMFPTALIIGEEAIAENPAALKKIGDAETSFTIDPVDGTANYASGLALFGVIISMLRYGQPVYALHYDPITDDAMVATQDSKTRLLRPRKAPVYAKTAKGAPVEELRGLIPLFLFDKDVQAQVAATYPRFARANSLRCSCHEYRQLAAGHVDFVMGVNCTPWDHAAGVLLTRQAGGYAAFLDGEDYRADRDDSILLVASDATTWGRVRDEFAFLIPDHSAASA